MQSNNLIAPIIVAIGVIIAAVAFAMVTTLLESADSAADLRLTSLEEAFDAEAAQRARLEAEIGTLKADLARLRDDMSLLANRAPVEPSAVEAPTVDADGLSAGEDGQHQPETEALTEQMRAARDRFNKGITQPRNKTMLALLGRPREDLGTDCRGISNPRLKSLVETRQIGTIKATMLKPALDSLERIVAKLQEDEPDIAAKLGTAGALCVRLIRGSNSSVSNHSFGTAIDITLQGELDPFADGTMQIGLVILAEHFNAEGWYWGGGYNREDGMHFEVGEETLKKWVDEGLIPSQ
ncbi:M15 family metallopeptidase [Tabrizicola sp.]|uniref:M15 family metallopeptidase n=1 Tax=Tabrizicola sp. TaxID=2005166 RepID=UPI0025CFB388|nr:M15 family metallopeptidase [Tabrizicola sp.]